MKIQYNYSNFIRCIVSIMRIFFTSELFRNIQHQSSYCKYKKQYSHQDDTCLSSAVSFPIYLWILIISLIWDTSKLIRIAIGISLVRLALWGCLNGRVIIRRAIRIVWIEGWGRVHLLYCICDFIRFQDDFCCNYAVQMKFTFSFYLIFIYFIEMLHSVQKKHQNISNEPKNQHAHFLGGSPALCLNTFFP